MHQEVIRKNLREFGVGLADLTAKLDLNLPKLVVKIGPEHQLPLDQLAKALKNNSMLIRSI